MLIETLTRTYHTTFYLCLSKAGFNFAVLIVKNVQGFTSPYCSGTVTVWHNTLPYSACVSAPIGIQYGICIMPWDSHFLWQKVNNAMFFQSRQTLGRTVGEQLFFFFVQPKEWSCVGRALCGGQAVQVLQVHAALLVSFRGHRHLWDLHTIQRWEIPKERYARSRHTRIIIFLQRLYN